MNYKFSIDVIRCEESRVFVGTSDDIPGLTLEADTLGNLFDAAMEVVPQLIERNLGVPRDAVVRVTVRVRSRSLERPATTKSAGRARKSAAVSRPRFVFEEEMDQAYAY